MNFQKVFILITVSLGAVLIVPFIPKARARGDYFQLTTMFLEHENKCFEGNRLAPESVLKGAAFMDDCQNVSGQLWKKIPADNGYFKLTTLFLEGQYKCLEGNQVTDGSVLGGAAFMDNCRNVSSQLWKVMPVGNGYYKLTTMFLEGQNKCLDGNRLAPESMLGGAAFMNDCQDVSGQLWTIK